tara:strand:- start:101 stop:1702 length:1602 start_codon:yes stop_codon:yes gene_type:complete
MSFLTDRPVGTILTVNDKIHVVDVDDLTGSPLGTSKQYTLQQLKTIVDSDTQDLENVLTYGNTMSDGQTIEAENGVSVFDPRFLGVDNNMSLYTGTHSSLGVGNESYIDLTPSYLGYGHGKAFLTMADFGATQTIFFGTSSDFFTANHSIMTLSESSASLKFVKAGISKSGLISIENNDLASYTTANVDNFPVNIGSKNALVSASIVNSAYLGGANIKVKTNNTAYVNQLGFNSGEAFETILNYTTATANNTVTIQDGSGTLAFLTDVSSMYGADGTTGAGRVVTLTDTLTFLDGTKKLVLGGGNYLDIEVTGGQSPITFYKNAGIATPAVIGDTTIINWSYNDSSGARTLSSGNIQNRVSSVGAGVVDSDITINNIFKVSSSGGVLVHPSASTQSVTAFLGIKQTAANPYNVCLALISKGNTSSQTIISVNNLSLQNGFSVLGDLKSIFNNNQLSTGDISHKGFTDSNLFYSDAGLDRVGIGTATAQMTSKLTVTGDVETLGNTNGFIVLDRTNATRYRIYSDGGVLSIETA